MPVPLSETEAMTAFARLRDERAILEEQHDAFGEKIEVIAGKVCDVLPLVRAMFERMGPHSFVWANGQNYAWDRDTGEPVIITRFYPSMSRPAYSEEARQEDAATYREYLEARAIRPSIEVGREDADDDGRAYRERVEAAWASHHHYRQGIHDDGLDLIAKVVGIAADTIDDPTFDGIDIIPVSNPPGWPVNGVQTYATPQAAIEANLNTPGTTYYAGKGRHGFTPAECDDVA